MCGWIMITERFLELSYIFCYLSLDGLLYEAKKNFAVIKLDCFGSAMVALAIKVSRIAGSDFLISI